MLIDMNRKSDYESINAGLSQIINEIIRSQSFEYDSFVTAKSTIQVNDYYMEYDRQTLLVYRHNFEKDDYKIFSKYIRDYFFSKKISHDGFQLRRELVELYYYLDCIDCVNKVTYKKQTHPDFILNYENRKVGIEITELCTQDDNVVNSIMRDISGKNMSEDEIKSLINTRYKHFANVIDVLELMGTNVVSGSVKNITSIKKDFANNIYKKYDKYKNMTGNFDDFIVLCDARFGIEITSKNDVLDIYDELKQYDMKNFCIDVMYIDNDDNKIKVERLNF